MTAPIARDPAGSPLALIEVQLCEACIDGDPGRCVTPGCALHGVTLHTDEAASAAVGRVVLRYGREGR